MPLCVQTPSVFSLRSVPPIPRQGPQGGPNHGKMSGFAQKSSGIIMEAERQNQLAARLADYAEREQALRRYL
ncbi:hypothetical protein MyNCGM152_22930 [Achromobacter xylosoxidans]